MDLVAACRAFVGVGDRGSFTLGAAAAGIPQPVASRRVAALERHLGAALFDRTGRGAVLTAFGRDLLPSARRLVDLADAVEVDADRALRRPFRLAVPGAPAAALARLVADARTSGTALEPVEAGPAERVDLVRAAAVRAGLVAVPAAQATWVVALGVAGTAAPRSRATRLDGLRPRRGSGTARRVHVQPEDAVPHVRDRLVREAAAVGLLPGQVVVAPSAGVAAAEVLLSDDLLLCSAREASELGLAWSPLAGLEPARGYAVTGGLADDARHVREALHDAVRRGLDGPA